MNHTTARVYCVIVGLMVGIVAQTAIALFWAQWYGFVTIGAIFVLVALGVLGATHQFPRLNPTVGKGNMR